eukprot:UN10871
MYFLWCMQTFYVFSTFILLPFLLELIEHFLGVTENHLLSRERKRRHRATCSQPKLSRSSTAKLFNGNYLQSILLHLWIQCYFPKTKR